MKSVLQKENLDGKITAVLIKILIIKIFEGLNW